MMKIVKVSEVEKKNTPHGIDARDLYSTDNALVVHIQLEPGEKLVKHITPVDVYFYVLEGEGVIEIGDEKKVVTKDTLIDSPKDIPHCWYNESDSILRVLVNKVPRPSDKTKLL